MRIKLTVSNHEVEKAAVIIRTIVDITMIVAAVWIWRWIFIVLWAVSK